MVCDDYAVIRLNAHSLSAIGLTKRADIFLSPYINQGLQMLTAQPPGYSLVSANNSFNILAFLPLNYLPDTWENGGIPANVANITAGLYIAKVPSTTYRAVNLSLCNAFHPMPAWRRYYSQVTIHILYYVKNTFCCNETSVAMKLFFR